ncbi:uncharacterized protein LOC131153866 [Malania oleifera]|uniref:uncharacterized protein LOC131153866 n=1 Tax=Malania oleifera TaxID=397392 RepID=UPI0025ADBB43|nr:uncharacterized protein LOC131153866 [Malania oleifera]
MWANDPLSDIKLIRTDTTLDLSQKAEKVSPRSCKEKKNASYPTATHQPSSTTAPADEEFQPPLPAHCQHSCQSLTAAEPVTVSKISSQSPGSPVTTTARPIAAAPIFSSTQAVLLSTPATPNSAEPSRHTTTKRTARTPVTRHFTALFSSNGHTASAPPQHPHSSAAATPATTAPATCFSSMTTATVPTVCVIFSVFFFFVIYSFHV